MIIIFYSLYTFCRAVCSDSSFGSLLQKRLIILHRIFEALSSHYHLKHLSRTVLLLFIIIIIILPFCLFFCWMAIVYIYKFNNYNYTPCSILHVWFIYYRLRSRTLQILQTKLTLQATPPLPLIIMFSSRLLLKLVSSWSSHFFYRTGLCAGR